MHQPPLLDLGRIKLPLYLISLASDNARRKQLAHYLPPHIISNYFEASDFRFSQSDDLRSLINTPQFLSDITE